MKTFLKTILAWIDWSMYCRSSEGKGGSSSYEFPVSICPLFWRTLFSIVALPITWFTHIWNFLFIKFETFRKEDFKTYKLNIVNTLVFTIAIILSGAIIFTITDGDKSNLNWDIFHRSDPFLLSYFKLIGAGIIGVVIFAIGAGIVIGVAALFWMAVTAIRDAFIDGKYDSDDNFIPSEERTINRVFDAIKNRYCPKIDWSVIKNKNEAR